MGKKDYEVWLESAQKAEDKGDHDTAQEFYKKAEVALLKLAFEADRNEDVHTAINYCEIAMGIGSAEAAFALGRIYSHGWMYHTYNSNVRDKYKAIQCLGTALFRYHKNAVFELLVISPSDDYSAKLWMSVFKGLKERVQKDGNPDDMFNLGILYRALATPETEENANIILEKARNLYAEAFLRATIPEAISQRANFFLNGYGIEEINKNLSFKLYKMAAEAGIKEAMLCVGQAYANEFMIWDNTVPKDMESAMKWYKKAADLGSVLAMYEMEELEKEKLKFEETRNKVEVDDPKSMYDLASMYMTGKFVAKDKNKALDLLIKAYPLAQLHDMYFLCGNISYEIAEINFSSDKYSEAMNWYTKAVDDGNYQAMENLAKMYREGKGVSKDDVYADQLLQIKKEFKDASEGRFGFNSDIRVQMKTEFNNVKEELVEAQYKVACRYLKGDFVKENCRKALAWFEQVAYNYIDTIPVRKYKFAALYTMAHLYEYGQGNVTKDLEKADRFYKEAREYKKYEDKNLALMVKKKIISSIRETTAEEIVCLKKAFESECSEDFSVAEDYYKKAMTLGNVEAAFYLGELLSRGYKKGVRTHTVSVASLIIAHKLGYDASSAMLKEKVATEELAKITDNYLESKECHRLFVELFDDLSEQVRNNGNINAVFNLAQLYNNGLGTEKSTIEAERLFKEAFSLYSKFACQGERMAITKLANFYLNGYGIVESDKERALELYKQTAEAGDKESMLHTADAYANTEEWADTVPKDMESAMKWYKKAADLGSVEAMRKIKMFGEPKTELEEAYQPKQEIEDSHPPEHIEETAITNTKASSSKVTSEDKPFLPKNWFIIVVIVAVLLLGIKSILTPDGESNQTSVQKETQMQDESKPVEKIPVATIENFLPDSDRHWIKDTNNNIYLWNPEPQEGESILWNGGFIQVGQYKLANGSGVLTWYRNGEVIQVDEGTFEQGKHHGQFKHTFKSGSIDYSNWNHGEEIALNNTPTSSAENEARQAFINYHRAISAENYSEAYSMLTEEQKQRVGDFRRYSLGYIDTVSSEVSNLSTISVSDNSVTFNCNLKARDWFSDSNKIKVQIFEGQVTLIKVDNRWYIHNAEFSKVNEWYED